MANGTGWILGFGCVFGIKETYLEVGEIEEGSRFRGRFVLETVGRFGTGEEFGSRFEAEVWI